MAQIYVNSGLAKPKAIHVYDELTTQWKSNRVGYVYYNGQWMPFIEYALMLYDGANGFVNGNFIFSYINHTRTPTQQADRILFEGAASSSSETANGGQYIVSNELYDLTNYTKIKVIAAKLSSFATVRFGPTLDKRASQYPSFEAEMNFSLNNYDLNEQVNIELDISDVNGEFYIRVQSRNLSGISSKFDVFKIWLE